MRVSARAAFVVIGVVLATSCSSNAKTTAPETPTTTFRTTVPDTAAQYASPGPFKVGYTTLRMTDREVAVWYPANPSAVAGEPLAKYDQHTTLPANLRHFVPDAYNTVVTMPAYDDVTGNTNGPFPVVLFSHGTPAHRLASATLDAGIASWGFVVVSVDYLERGQITQLPGQRSVSIDAVRDRRLMLASLDLVTAENNRAGSVLHGVVDATRVASLGHSAGGTVAFDALSDPRLAAAIGWAPANPSGPVSRKPTMIIGASGDIAVTPATLTAAYAGAPAPKRFVEIGPAGHNSFTDLCLITRAGGGPVKFAIDSHTLSQAAAKLFLNGCGKADLTPERFFPVVQHFTVAELRDVFRIDASPVGLGDGVTQAFPGVTVTYRHVP